MISHPDINVNADEAVIFAELSGFTCSICAPSLWDVARVVAFAEEKMPSTSDDRWRSVDKSTLALGTSTPNPCNQYDGRTHHFMLRGPGADR